MNGDESGPVIVDEPENRVDFSNSSGATLDCAVKGRPAPSVIWTRAEDGTAVGDVPGLRKVRSTKEYLYCIIFVVKGDFEK